MVFYLLLSLGRAMRFLNTTRRTVSTVAAMSIMSSQNPVVVQIGGGKSVRIIVSDFEFATETDGLVVLVVTTVSQ